MQNADSQFYLRRIVNVKRTFTRFQIYYDHSTNCADLNRNASLGNAHLMHGQSGNVLMESSGER